MSELPSVAVVVAAFDAEATLAECLDSLLALRYPRDRIEIVVVDNGSRDRTRELAQRERVTLLHESRRGPAAARNAGIRQSRSEVVALTDADCAVDSGWLEALVLPLADPRVGIAGGAIRARRPANRIELYGEAIHDHRLAIEHWRPPYVITMNWAARRDVIAKLGPFDEKLLRSSDVDYSYRAGREGYVLAFQPEAVVYHRNERSLVGLACEGWTHGFYGSAVQRKHADYVAASLRDTPAAPAEPREARPFVCDAVFRLASRAGRVSGRLLSFR